MIDYTRLMERLKKDEGAVRNKAGRHVVYKDSLGYETVGYGRLLSRGLTEAEAENLLRTDIMLAVRAVENEPWFEKLNDVRREVVSNMIFNLGESRFRKFRKMLLALEKGDYAEAAAEMKDSRWYRQVKGRATRLAKEMETGSLQD